jgi:hypothetical protein
MWCNDTCYYWCTSHVFGTVWVFQALSVCTQPIQCLTSDVAFQKGLLCSNIPWTWVPVQFLRPVHSCFGIVIQSTCTNTRIDIKTTPFWRWLSSGSLRSQVEIYRRFRGACWLHQGDATTQKTAIFILAAASSMRNIRTTQAWCIVEFRSIKCVNATIYDGSSLYQYYFGPWTFNIVWGVSDIDCRVCFESWLYSRLPVTGCNYIDRFIIIIISLLSLKRKVRLMRSPVCLSVSVCPP